MGDLSPLLVAIGAVIVSVIGGTISIALARRKGMPAINAEIEDRNRDLITTMRSQIEAQNSRINGLSNDFDACKARLGQTMLDNERLTRNLMLTEGELLDLYRKTGVRPPPRLSNRSEAPVKDDDSG
jgi:hypothetical protein